MIFKLSTWPKAIDYGVEWDCWFSSIASGACHRDLTRCQHCQSLLSSHAGLQRASGQASMWSSAACSTLSESVSCNRLQPGEFGFVTVPSFSVSISHSLSKVAHYQYLTCAAFYRLHKVSPSSVLVHNNRASSSSYKVSRILRSRLAYPSQGLREITFSFDTTSMYITISLTHFSVLFHWEVIFWPRKAKQDCLHAP